MSSYDQPRVVSYPLNALSLAAAATIDVPLPLGAKVARVLDIVARVTTTVNGDTTPPRIDVGRSGDLDEFASLTIPDGTVAGTVRGFRTAGGGLNSVYVAEAGGTAALDALRVTVVAGTGTPAGVADVVLVVEFDYVKADL